MFRRKSTLLEFALLTPPARRAKVMVSMKNSADSATWWKSASRKKRKVKIAQSAIVCISQPPKQLKQSMAQDAMSFLDSSFGSCVARLRCRGSCEQGHTVCNPFVRAPDAAKMPVCASKHAVSITGLKSRDHPRKRAAFSRTFLNSIKKSFQNTGERPMAAKSARRRRCRRGPGQSRRRRSWRTPQRRTGCRGVPPTCLPAAVQGRRMPERSTRLRAPVYRSIQCHATEVRGVSGRLRWQHYGVRNSRRSGDRLGGNRAG